MGATAVNVDNEWREVIGVYQNLEGQWVVASADTIHITQNVTSTIYIASFLGNDFLAKNDTINIVIDAGVTVTGTTGTDGGNGRNANGVYMANCHSGSVGNGQNGFNGEKGFPVFDFTGISGKTFQIVNNGIIKNSNGGKGGNGGGALAYVCTVVYGGCGGVGGVAGDTVLNPNGNTITFIGNPPLIGSVGASGAHGSPSSIADSCNCSCCFTENTQILMEDHTYKNIQDVVIGDRVIGAFGDINEVIYLQRPSGKNQKIYNINGLNSTDEHGIVNGERNGFGYISLISAIRNVGTWHDSIDKFGNQIKLFLKGFTTDKIKTEEISSDSEIYTICGSVKAEVSLTDMETDTLYHLVLTGGSKTYCADGVFVSGWCDEESFLKYIV